MTKLKRKSLKAIKTINKPAEKSNSSSKLKLDFKFKKFFWNKLFHEPLTDELKAKRKSLGIHVRGPRSDCCPPPIEKIETSNMPIECISYLNRLGFNTPSPIQMQSWPAILSGNDIIGIAPTGSGKTLAYTLPMIPHIKYQMEVNHFNSVGTPRALVIVPTRELCIQIELSLRPFSKLYGIRCCCLYGGQDKDSQFQIYKDPKGIHIIVCTPGRLVDFLSNQDVHLDYVTYVVLDEADRLLALGFEEQLNTILSYIRSDRQTLMFSASFPGHLRKAASSWLTDELLIRCGTIEVLNSGLSNKSTKDFPIIKIDDNIDKDSQDHDTLNYKSSDITLPSLMSNLDPNSHSSSVAVSPTINQKIHVCASHKKPRLLLHYLEILRSEEKRNCVRQPAAVLIFCNKIVTVKFVMDWLMKHGHNTGSAILHGSMPQNQRETILSDFRGGKTNVLITTDVCARGVHIKRLRYVVNYDFPGSIEQYCHRIGRVGRQGEAGESYSLITRNMIAMVPALVRLLQSYGQEIEPNLRALAEEAELIHSNHESVVNQNDNHDSLES